MSIIALRPKNNSKELGAIVSSILQKQRGGDLK